LKIETGSQGALRRETLRRQFPAVTGKDPVDLVDVFERIGPVQSQAPRAPFLAAAARLPGITAAALTEAFEQHQLVLGSSLRGTVHTSTPGQFRLLHGACAPRRAADLSRMFGLEGSTASQLVAEIERAATGRWCDRSGLVAHIVAWLEQEDPIPDRPAPTTMTENLVWGHPGLLRRPRGHEWHRRGETVHRLAAAVLRDQPADHPAIIDAEVAREALVRLHLSAYGPSTRRDIAWWLGEKVTAVDSTVRQLGDEITAQSQPGGDPLLDLAESPAGGNPEPGVRLLPEFDGLLLGFAPPNRDRFLRPEHLPYVWNRANGLFRPVVLADDHLVATWRLTTVRGRTALEVTMLPGEVVLGSARLADPAAALAAALAQPVDEIHARPAVTAGHGGGG